MNLFDATLGELEEGAARAFDNTLNAHLDSFGDEPEPSDEWFIDIAAQLEWADEMDRLHRCCVPAGSVVDSDTAQRWAA